jgi:predicted AAA+ superfamily ATPase
LNVKIIYSSSSKEGLIFNRISILLLDLKICFKGGEKELYSNVDVSEITLPTKKLLSDDSAYKREVIKVKQIKRRYLKNIIVFIATLECYL